MTRILLVGTGAVGSHAARQLAETPGVELLVGDRSEKSARSIGSALDAEVVDPSDEWPGDLTAVALAVDAGDDVGFVRRATSAGVPVATCGDDHESIRELLELSVGLETPVIAGAGLAPGLSDVLAVHAAASLDSVTEVHIARYGSAGPASRSAFRQAHRDRAVEWRDRAWQVARSRGPELVWFPDPVAAQECESVAGGISLIVSAFADVEVATFRLGDPVPRRRLPWRRPDDWGAVHVEVWGHSEAATRPVVYGAIDRTAFAAGTVLAVTAAGLVGAIPDVVDAAPGVAGLAAASEPTAFLAELAKRGVKAAAFEGVPVA